MLLLINMFIFDGKIKLKNQLETFVWIEIAYAWSAVEVFIFLVIVALFEI